jgi:hypothetical protein
LLPKFKGKEIYIFPACQLDADVKVDPIQSIEAVEEAISKLGRLEKGTIVLDSATDLWQKEAATASFAEALLSPVNNHCDCFLPSGSSCGSSP